MTIPKQFTHNQGILSEQEMELISTQHVVVIGCGGIGGYVANHLVRLGVQHLILVDFDTFEESNLNRQLFSNHNTLQDFKVDVLQQELTKINPNVNIKTYHKRIEDVPQEIFEKVDYLFDCVDSPMSKVYLNKQATFYNRPLVHGACAGWYVQVGVLEPGCMVLEELYKNHQHGIETELHNPTFTPAVTASYMISEWVKHITNDASSTTNQLLLIDLKNTDIITSGGRS